MHRMIKELRINSMIGSVRRGMAHWARKGILCVMFGVTFSAVSAAQPETGSKTLLRNETSSVQTCRFRGEATDWTTFQAISPDTDLVLPASAETRFFVECQAPVAKQTYAMEPGNRYGLRQGKGRDVVDVLLLPRQPIK